MKSPRTIMFNMEWSHETYILTDDRAKVDLDAVERLLRGSYWAGDRPREVMARSIANSVCFTLLHENRVVGFARIVSDHATFAWIADVIIDPAHRGRGLGKWLMRCVMEHPSVARCTRHLLRTQDAHALYEQFGFTRTDCMMRLIPPRVDGENGEA